jgi:hypothetical protein
MKTFKRFSIDKKGRWRMKELSGALKVYRYAYKAAALMKAGRGIALGCAAAALAVGATRLARQWK